MKDSKELKESLADPRNLGVFAQPCPKGYLYRPANIEEVGQRARKDAERLKKRFNGYDQQKGGDM